MRLPTHFQAGSHTPGSESHRASPGSKGVKNLPVMQEILVCSLGGEDPLEKEMATHSSILPGESHGQRSLLSYSLRGRKESITEHTHTPFSLNFPENLAGEGLETAPPRCCLLCPTDGCTLSPISASRHRLIITKEKVSESDEHWCGTASQPASQPVQGVCLNSIYTADILFILLLRPAVFVGQACTRLPQGVW